MKSHLGRIAFNVLGAIGLMMTGLAAEAQTGQNLVINGDFEKGNAGFTSGYTVGDVSNPGGYVIGTSPSKAPGAFGDWCNCGDHTTGTGMMMIVNGATSAGVPIWGETVNVTPSTEYTFSFWGAEVDHDSSSLPRVLVRINGRVIGNSTLPQYSPDNGGKWESHMFRWNSGTSDTADLTLVDQNIDSGWNDFALDDISFSAGSGVGGGAGTPAGNAASSGAVTTHAQVSVKDEQGVEISLKQEEKLAVMFVETIGSMEDDCNRHLSRRCSLAELIAGPTSPGWNIGRLKYDPARDPNYKYTVTISGTGWVASATPQRAGLGGIFVDGNHGMIPNSYYKANGPASAKDTRLGEISVGGETFQVH